MNLATWIPILGSVMVVVAGIIATIFKLQNDRIDRIQKRQEWVVEQINTIEKNYLHKFSELQKAISEVTISIIKKIDENHIETVKILSAAKDEFMKRAECPLLHDK